MFSRARLNLEKPVLIKYPPVPCNDSFILSLSVTQSKLEEDVKGQPTHFAPPPQKFSSEERKQRWEAGQIDYLGDDSFANIERKLDSFLK